MTTLRDLAEAAARSGGAILRERFGAARSTIDSKTSSTDMVTDADLASEDAVRAVIAAARPDDAILGEEGGETPGSSGLRWVIDPLDGTTNFLFGIAWFCVSVGVEDDDGGLAACIYEPIRGTCFTAARDEGATRDGEPIHVSSTTDLALALIATGFGYVPGEREAEARMLPTVLPNVRDIRREGSAALDLASVACGRLDAYYEVPAFPWDVAAGTLLVREAGGVVQPLDAVGPSGRGLIASGPALAGPLAALLARARDTAGLRT